MVTRESEATIIGLFFFRLCFVWLLITAALSVFSSFSFSFSPLCLSLLLFAHLPLKHQLIPHTYNDLILKMIFTSPGESVILPINTLSKEYERVLYMMHYTTSNGPVNGIILLR